MGLRVDVAELASWRVPASLAGRGLLIAGTFDQDVEAVRRIRTAAVEVELVGCVGAGIDEFRARLGPLAEGVLAPVQWVNRDHPAEVGPTAATFARRFEARTGATPDYPAAQAAATGWLAAEATRRGLTADEVHQLAHLHTARRLRPRFVVATGRPHADMVQWDHGRLDTI